MSIFLHAHCKLGSWTKQVCSLEPPGAAAEHPGRDGNPLDLRLVTPKHRARSSSSTLTVTNCQMAQSAYPSFEARTRLPKRGAKSPPRLEFVAVLGSGNSATSDGDAKTISGLPCISLNAAIDIVQWAIVR